MGELRNLIDFASGNNWEMPLQLYQSCENDYLRLQLGGKLPLKDITPIELWLSTLTPAEKALLRKL
jgi:hypothetical protein